MAKNSVGEYFVQEFIIGLGLLGGIGVDPEGEILKALNQAIKEARAYGGVDGRRRHF